MKRAEKKTEDASLACRIRFIVAVQQWRRLAFRRRPMKTNTVQKSERRFSTLNAESNSNLKRKTRNKIMAGFENPVRICRKDVKLREKRAAQHTASHEPQTRWYAKESERDLSMKDGWRSLLLSFMSWLYTLRCTASTMRRKRPLVHSKATGRESY